MLILGESHYDLPEREVPEYTCKWVRDYAEHGKTNRFFTVVTKLFLGLPNGSSPSSDERSAFWQRVAFHNYIQSFPGERARLRPTAAMWADAARCLTRCWNGWNRSLCWCWARH
ncbi:hypothetical protein GCM10027285_00790 [Oleiagrimonas citrea]|uniref:hypothetical protein n=1 Tax=Oleiagrimonas citrea TaxID=1665687 RepID=UPI001966643C|nr:hypothetical protein [Oleiagrimonas citrea]